MCYYISVIRFCQEKTYCGINRSPSAGVTVFTAKYSYEFKLKAENKYINAEKKHDYAAKKHNMISSGFNKKLNRPTVRIIMPTDRRPSEFSLP